MNRMAVLATASLLLESAQPLPLIERALAGVDEAARWKPDLMVP